MPRIERDREIARRRQRKQKIQKLIEKYMKATAQADKTLIATKVRRLSPFYNVDERVAAIKAGQKTEQPPQKKK
jgi:hypothetical protein